MSIYQAIRNDHLKLKSLLNDLVELEKDDEFRMTLIEDLGKQLIPHIRAEEAIFYNTLRGVNADKKLLFHAFQEHIEIEGLFRSLQVLDKFKLNWLPTAKKLQDIIFRHIQNEEYELLEIKMEKDLEKENSHLRAALALAVGSLESVRYLINSTDCDPDQRDHIKSITERVLKDIQELVD